MTMTFPDTCKIPAGRTAVPTPYPNVDNVTLINIGEAGSKNQVYRLDKNAIPRLVTDRNLASAKTFIIGDDGKLVGIPGRCTSPSEARRLVTGKLGTDAVATVVSVAERNEAPVAFRVTKRTQRRVKANLNPPSLVAAIRRQ